MQSQGILAALKNTYTGVASQMKRLEVISENIANAEALPDENGQVYKRKVAVPKGSAGDGRPSFGDQMALHLRRSNDRHLAVGGTQSGAGNTSYTSQQPYQVVEIDGERLIHDPGHPRADEKGYVRMPDVNVVEEMVDLMATSRAYEANITVMGASKAMAKRIFEI